MAHHKRKKPKHQRAGCLLCKPHKDQRVKGAKETEKPSVRRKTQDSSAERVINWMKSPWDDKEDE